MHIGDILNQITVVAPGDDPQDGDISTCGLICNHVQMIGEVEIRWAKFDNSTWHTKGFDDEFDLVVIGLRKGKPVVIDNFDGGK